jgi:pantoate kinase
MKARAFCPGHITGFFEICTADNVLATGSRGAGLCTTLGATSEVRVEDAKELTVEVSINGESIDADVTQSAVRHLVVGNGLLVRVDTTLELPVSQGFGMSAAGALSACIALAHILGIDRQKAFEAAHTAEVECGGGLGDVPAVHRAGVTIRGRPGLPPIGEVHRIEEELDVVLTTVGPPIKTSDMLTNPPCTARINRSGAVKVGQLLASPTVDNLMHLSSDFAIETRLATGPVTKAMKAASAAGVASMAMLGNSVFATGRTDELMSILSEFGEARLCGVDNVGARLE